MRPSKLARCKVLVTGASGFIAVWVVRYLLERGHHVRGTVRSANKGRYLQKLFKEYGTSFEYVLVEDLSKRGAFDGACKGMDAVIHTASPFHLNADLGPQNTIGPAVHGTECILESALNSPTVKRVVITSSIAAISDLPHAYDPTNVVNFTEKDWYLDPVREFEGENETISPGVTYQASKILAEQAAWKFLEKHKGEVNFDLVSLQPSWVFGPVIHEVASPSALNTSSALFFSMLVNMPPKSAADLVAPAGSVVDVRDLAWAHAECLLNDEVASKDGRAALERGIGRVLVSAREFAWQDVVDAINVSSSALPAQTVRGKRGAAKKTIHPVQYESKRARDVLGLRFRPFAETFVDTLESFREKGWVE